MTKETIVAKSPIKLSKDKFSKSLTIEKERIENNTSDMTIQSALKVKFLAHSKCMSLKLALMKIK